METGHFAELDELGAGYWWFATRFETVWRLAVEALQASPRRVVDLGCGTGTFLEWLAKEKGLAYSELLGLDGAEAALRATARRGIAVKRCDLSVGDLSSVVPWAADTFVMLDVLEHLQEPVRALQAARAVARGGGVIALTVPALPVLWSNWDARLGHYRRYTRRRLVSELRAAGWYPGTVQYLFCGMVLPGLMRRLGSGSQRDGDPGFPRVSAPLNALLTRWFRAEARLGRLLPAGTSLAAVAWRDAPRP